MMTIKDVIQQIEAGATHIWARVEGEVLKVTHHTEGQIAAEYDKAVAELAPVLAQYHALVTKVEALAAALGKPVPPT
jgi:hypothetical protein